MIFEKEFQQAMGDAYLLTDEKAIRRFMDRKLFERMTTEGDIEDRRAVADLFESLVSVKPPQIRKASTARQ